MKEARKNLVESFRSVRGLKRLELWFNHEPLTNFKWEVVVPKLGATVGFKTHQEAMDFVKDQFNRGAK